MLADSHTDRMLRLATWNCRGAFKKKKHIIEAIDADVLVVQECSKTDALATDAPWSPPFENGTKGTAVFCRAPWKASRLEADPTLPWVLPVELSHAHTGRSINLLAFWANKTKTGPSHAEQFAMLMDSYADMIRSGHCLIAGDLNASIQGPSKRPHARNLRQAEGLGLVSAYHYANRVEHGKEKDMTLRWIGPGRNEHFYHCDFIFVPLTLASGMGSSVIDTFAWTPPVSDHRPVIIDIPGL